eukprot:bmy_08312T0
MCHAVMPWLHHQTSEAPGGLGNADGIRHRRISFDKYHPGYFVKVGMRHHHLKEESELLPHCQP